MLFVTVSCALTVGSAPVPMVAAQEGGTAQAGEKAASGELSGTVEDVSGALLARAEVQLRNANGSVQRTGKTDSKGTFTFHGLAPGTYRLSVSRVDFDRKELSVTLRNAAAPAPVRVALTVHVVSTTVEVQGPKPRRPV